MSEQTLSRRHLLRMFAGGAALAFAGPARAEHARMTQLIEKAHALPAIGERIDLISRALLGAPYRSYTLVGGPRKAEQFVTRDDAFDCVTYCEAVLAAASVRKANGHKGEDYETALRHIRYRDGAVSWRTRNHYFAQWCENNIANHRCRPVEMPGGVTIDKTISYMRALGTRRMQLAAIPRASLLANKHLLATGDIIGFMSQRPRVDYYHTGFVIVADSGEPWLRHAAESRRRVLDEPLNRFMAANRVKAVTVLRPRELEATTALI